MKDEIPTKKTHAMTTNNYHGYYNPFPAIFTSLSNFPSSIFEQRNSANKAKAENKALHEQLESIEAEIADKICDGDELEELNSTLYETAIPLKTNADEMKIVVKLRGEEASKWEKLVFEKEEQVRILEKALQNVENEKCGLEVGLDEQKVVMERQSEEWACVVEKENQKSCSLQEKLDEKCRLEKKYEVCKMSWEKRIDHANEVVSALVCEKGKLVKDCDGMNEENRRLRDVCRRLRAEK